MNRMTASLWLLLCVLLSLGAAGGASAKTNDVPEAWLDSLNANLWRMDMDSLGYAVDFTTVTEQLTKSGEVKKTETVQGVICNNEQGERVMRVLDENGEVKEEQTVRGNDEREMEEEEEEKDEEEFSMNPFEAFSPKHRAEYRFALDGTDGEGHPVLRLQPFDTGFDGTMSLDTTLWVPLVVEGSPNPYPKHVKDMTMTLEFSPNGEGANLMQEMVTVVHAKFLLLSFNMRIHQSYSNHRKQEG